VTRDGVAERGIVAHLAAFAGALRERGVPVGLSDEMDAATALTLVDLLDRDEVAAALKCALKLRREHWVVFDELFGRLWRATRPMAHVERHTRPAADRAVSRAGRADGAPGGSEGGGREAPAGEPGYSADEVLRRKPFEAMSEQEIAQMERLLARLALRLATRRSRRLVPTRSRGLPDLRRSLRGAVATGGEPLALARRQRAVEEARLVVLCDTSGSMDAHARFLLAFILSLGRTARRTEAFAFNTSLTRITPLLAAGKAAISLDRLSAGVPDWSGGTRIGECLAAFVEQHLQRVVRPGTTVVVLSDGLDRGDPAVLAEAMRAIRARARKVIWLNPLMGDARYRPLARGMEAALPFVDHLASAHNLRSFEEFLTLVPA
jgi:uncharacterized protein with von Willebrand factor type A (vWA) domain